MCLPPRLNIHVKQVTASWFQYATPAISITEVRCDFLSKSHTAKLYKKFLLRLRTSANCYYIPLIFAEKLVKKGNFGVRT